MNKEFRLKTKEGNFLNISAFGLEHINELPCLILVHGFKGFKDWGFFPYAAKFFADKGYFVLTFNFSHNGIGLSNVDFEEIDKFAKNTISLEISELDDLINAYSDGYFGNNKFNKIYLIGHSRGGAVSILSSHINHRPSGYVVWASVAKLGRYTERQKEIWRKNGFIEIPNSRTKQIMRLNFSYLEDIERNINGSLNLEKAVKNLNKPLLIVHGEQDLTVSISEGKQIFQWSNKEYSELFTVPNAGHTFDVVHPFEGSNYKFDSVLDKTNNFLKKLYN